MANIFFPLECCVSIQPFLVFFMSSVFSTYFCMYSNILKEYRKNRQNVYGYPSKDCYGIGGFCCCVVNGKRSDEMSCSDYRMELQIEGRETWHRTIKENILK